MDNTKFRIVALVVLLGLLVAGCGPSEEEIAAQTATVEAKATSTAEVQATATAETQATATAEVQATQTAVAVEANVAAMPLSQKLYLAYDDEDSSDIDILTLNPTSWPERTSYSWPGARISTDWTIQLSDESLASDYTYDLVMASTGTSSVTVELILKQGAQETTLGKDNFVVDSTYYLPYRGQFSGTSTAITSGERVIILRLTVSGDDYRIAYGGSESSISILEAPAITDAISAHQAEERTKALTWMATNAEFDPSAKIFTQDLFTDFREKLDYAILSDYSARWVIGWDLTVSGKPYSLEWMNGVFGVEEISVEEAQELDGKAESVIFELIP